MTGYELNYSLVENVCWALTWVTKRLRHYMQAHTVKLVSRLDPICHLFQKTHFSPRLAKWMMIIPEYDIVYTVQKSIKGSVVADFLADQPIGVEDDEDLAFPNDEVMTINPTTWRLLFDGASGKQGYGIGILLIDHVGTYNPILVKLEYQVTNDEEEYEECIFGLKIAHEKGARRLEVVRDSNLVISQANGEWPVKRENLKPYHQHLLTLMTKFEHVTFTHASRS
ncbi:uncharacterized protein LOC124934440 [Impatiens glandulifera]|uniref:uncharacterized protein LOC124934440 n=1 Tax=Impatiens glandulifera TaxID=253017 RepID=UPI001FB0FD58|nr:uncharacterized protein LOC124934440 [Impatiens glandulifera]